MLADTSERVVLLDARLASLADQFAAARASGDEPRVTVLRRRLDVALDSRHAETQR